MSNHESSRRSFMGQSLSAVGAGLAIGATLPGLAQAEEPGKDARKLKVVCIGAHPDDPESSCPGTLLRYVEQGHAVTVVYLTRGERGIHGKSNDEAAAIRSAEAEEACKLMGAKPVFAGQIDGSSEFTAPRADELIELLQKEAPDVLLAHWPIDTHRDHQVASALATRAYMVLKPQPQLYFFEVNTGSQSQGFFPNTYVDVSAVLEKKKAVLLCHRSQGGPRIWAQHHGPIAEWRGREIGVDAAEAYVRLSSPFTAALLPGVVVA